MLFSRDDVADLVNRNFEPVWESVRPVPLVRIDFGNGNVLTRTLNGNIATYVCTSDGKTLDVLPGVYDPATYRDRLNQFRLLANYVDQDGAGKREARANEYHKGQAEALAKNQPPARFVNMANESKRRIEGGLKAMLVGGARPEAAPEPKAVTDDANDLADWKPLAEDTARNESVRRRQIHEMLARTGPVAPSTTKNWLYREVLNADLEDPYLGLGKTLFANDVFEKEDKAR